ncbi:MAG TPA: ROK family protein [Chitinophagaceae bacterium]|nr:ROK family protein [Chitinophagaceae bacterium]
MKFAIGIDLGGTRIKGIAADAEGNTLHKLYMPTNDSDEAIWKDAVAETVHDLLEKVNNKDGVVGISAPGLPSDDNTSIVYMPGRMQGLENFEWQRFLQKPTYVINDAIAALIAESKFGVAKNKKHVVMLTLGTGVGGAILINGQPYMGAFNKAGHIGHMVINEMGDCDITGMPGSLEECIGNCTVGKRSKGKFTSTHELLDAHNNGDAFAKEIWLTSVRQLAIGLASVTNILSPEMIVLGGGIAEAGNVLFEPLNEYMTQFEWRPGGNKVEIVKAGYSDFAGAVGAANFAMSKMLDKF